MAEDLREAGSRRTTSRGPLALVAAGVVVLTASGLMAGEQASAALPVSSVLGYGVVALALLALVVVRRSAVAWGFLVTVTVFGTVALPSLPEAPTGVRTQILVTGAVMVAALLTSPVRDRVRR